MTELMKIITPFQNSYDAVQFDIDKIIPRYFNTGCCCFSDGDITGIEIEADQIRLVKWKKGAAQESSRIILEESCLSDLMQPTPP